MEMAGSEVESENKARIPVHKPGIKEKTFFFSSGILISVPFTVFFSQFSNVLCIALPVLVSQVCSSVILAPFIEEFAKVLPLFYRHGETERSTVKLGILTGVGFGATEFVLYVFVLSAPFISRLPGIIFHGCSAGIVAYGLASKKPILYYLIATALHLVNNLFALFPNMLGYVIGPAILVATYLIAWYLYRKTTERIVV